MQLVFLYHSDSGIVDVKITLDGKNICHGVANSIDSCFVYQHTVDDEWRGQHSFIVENLSETSNCVLLGVKTYQNHQEIICYHRLTRGLDGEVINYTDPLNSVTIDGIPKVIKSWQYRGASVHHTIGPKQTLHGLLTRYSPSYNSLEFC
jgi:hypothetical protein